MEKGTIQFIDKNSGTGTIRRLADTEVRFNTANIIGRDKMSLQIGDFVWFEVENVGNIHTAINIRKCY